jgi:hypothetical protein
MSRQKSRELKTPGLLNLLNFIEIASSTEKRAALFSAFFGDIQESGEAWH